MCAIVCSLTHSGHTYVNINIDLKYILTQENSCSRTTGIEERKEKRNNQLQVRKEQIKND